MLVVTTGYDQPSAAALVTAIRVRVFNSRGEILLTARVNGATRAGVVAARLNWAKLTPQLRNINVLTSERQVALQQNRIVLRFRPIGELALRHPWRTIH